MPMQTDYQLIETESALQMDKIKKVDTGFTDVKTYPGVAVEIKIHRVGACRNFEPGRFSCQSVPVIIFSRSFAREIRQKIKGRSELRPAPACTDVDIEFNILAADIAPVPEAVSTEFLGSGLHRDKNRRLVRGGKR